MLLLQRYGESYYLQIDAHMFFAPHWDTIMKKDLELAERPKPVITNYPPPDGARWQNTVGLRYLYWWHKIHECLSYHYCLQRTDFTRFLL